MIYVLLDDNERLALIINAIRNYHEGENDIGVLIVYEVTQSILSIVTQQFDTQELYDEIAECFTLYNTFIVAKGIDLPMIEDEMFIQVVDIINEIVEINNDNR